MGALCRKLVLTAAFAIVFGAQNVQAQNVRLIGSGASFPFPIYSAWFKQFSKGRPGIIVDYQAKGTGAGIPPRPFPPPCLT